MRSPRVAFILVLLSSLLFLSTAVLSAHKPRENRSALALESSLALISDYHGRAVVTAELVGAPAASDQGGIREDIPEKYSARYQQWKKEFLSTPTGREQWEFYKNKPNFTLTINVSRNNSQGGTTSNYKWDESGQLVAATITLGSRLDAGYPNPVYFPVMNSLLSPETSHKIDGETLAATKMAHEFGHVIRTAKGDATLYQLQTKLMPQYNQIFLSNGRNPNDPRLIELAKKMGGTPVKIWEDREYWGETNAMLYLRDRFAEDEFRCQLFSRIKHSVHLYAVGYKERFLSVAQSTPRHCGW